MEQQSELMSFCRKQKEESFTNKAALVGVTFTMNVCGQKVGNQQRPWLESRLGTTAPPPSLRLGSPRPPPSPTAAVPKSKADEARKAQVENVGAVGKLAMATGHQKAWRSTSCVWPHSRTPSGSGDDFLST